MRKKAGHNHMTEDTSLMLHHKAEEAAAGLPALKAAAEKAAKSILTGEHTQRKAGTGERFWQYREYTPGDRIQDIDWRASARGDRLYIRQKEWQTTQTALFWVQNDDAMSFASANALPAKGEAAATLALALAILMTRTGEQVGLVSGAMRPGRTDNAIQRLGEHIIHPEDKPLPDSDGHGIKADSNLILIGDFLAPAADIERQLTPLLAATENAMIIQVLDPAEYDLPFTGRVVFEKSEQEKHHVANVESIRKDYKERVNAHLDEIRDMCRRHRWHWLLHLTERDIRDSLFDAWMMITHEQMGRPAGTDSGSGNSGNRNRGGRA